MISELGDDTVNIISWFLWSVVWEWQLNSSGSEVSPEVAVMMSAGSAVICLFDREGRKRPHPSLAGNGRPQFLPCG